jgi:hypothetical protein
MTDLTEKNLEATLLNLTKTGKPIKIKPTTWFVRRKILTPIDFVIFDGDSTPNLPVYQVAEAMSKPIRIYSAEKEWEVIGYYYADGQMMLDLKEVST